MSQKAVEVLIGKLVTDDAFRRGFQLDREATFQMMEWYGLALTPIEREALSALDVRSCDRFAQKLDSRIRKASAHPAGPVSP